MKLRFRVLTVVIAILLGLPLAASAQTVTLAWDAPPDADVTGYRVYYGTASRNYSNSVDAGNTTSYTVSGLDITRAYYFAVVAYNAQGATSDFSAEVVQPASPTRITSFTSSVVSPLLVGQPVTWSAVATSTAGPVQYKFLRYSAATGWTIAQDWSASNTLTFTPGWGELGSHSIQAWARTIGSTAAYEAWVGSGFTVNPRAVTLSADLDFPAPPGSRITWTAAVAGSSGPLEYRFLALNQQTGVWSVLREYAQSNQFVWTPSTVGTHILQVWVRAVGSTATYQAWASSGVATISRTPLSVSVSSNLTTPAKAGTPITWTARPRGGTNGPIEYEFVRYSYKTNAWAVVRPYSQSPSFTWTPGWGDDGRFVLQVWARNAGSTATYDAWTSTPVFEIERAPLVITLNQPFPAPPGTAVTLTAQVEAAGVAFEYQFLLYDRSTGTWTMARPYATSNTFTWTPTVTGTYLFQVWARQVGSSAAYDLWRATDYLEVSRTPARVVALTADRSLPAAAGTAVRWTAEAVGGTARPLQYRYFVYSETTGAWTALGEYSQDPSVTWTPTTPGRYLVQVWVRSAGSTAAQEGWMSSGFVVITP